MNTAVDDGLIRRNPCRIKGASEETSPERPVLSVTQVYALAEAIDRRYRALVLLAAFGSLRWGELAALRRSDIDLANRTIRVDRQLYPQVMVTLDAGGAGTYPQQANPGSEPSQRLSHPGAER
jgi:integrase